MAFENRRANKVTGASSGTRVTYGIPMTSYGTTISQPGQTSTSLQNSLPRSRATTPAGASVVAGWRTGAALWWRGDAANRGGFTFYCRFALNTFITGQRAFAGLRATAAQIGAVEPSALVDIIGIGFDTGQTQWRLLHNDGSGSATAVALGANFNVTLGDVLELRLTAAPGAATVAYRVRNLTSGQSTSGTISTDLPSSTTFLSGHLHVDSGSDATTSVTPDLIDMFVDPPFPTVSA